MSETNPKTHNSLIHETSPYLLQHAFNPVNWLPWGQKALQKAQKEDKPILVSIGYSACHWCHVMERESFEDQEIADIMNEHFVCIKVDREERPDVDHIYMAAIQAMAINGGWPLNVFLMPDQKPFYGGTYFPPKQWAGMLLQIAQAFRDQRDQLAESANGFAAALNRKEAEKYGLAVGAFTAFDAESLKEAFGKYAAMFDPVEGGTNKAPKFPMPCGLSFLLRYQAQTGDKQALAHALLTLNKMKDGGIYDQIGGGFARYSVDEKWFAPHFEKMLYDNGQLLGLYAEAYALTKEESYKEVVLDTADWLMREMVSPQGGFYSALDADSEGVEGKYYVWTAQEFEDALGGAAEAANPKKYFSLAAEGNWEHGVNILFKTKTDKVQATNFKMEDLAELGRNVKTWKKKLLTARETRIKPGLDDKIISGWNALAIKGLALGYAVLKEDRLMSLAMRAAEFVRNKMTVDGLLYHCYKDGKLGNIAFLDDYAALIDAYITLYQSCFEERWLKEAEVLMQYALTHFHDPADGLFFYTDTEGERLIARNKEIFDNVIPASNSIMASNLYFLGKLLSKQSYLDLASQMLATVKPLLKKDIQYLSNWGSLYTNYLSDTVEIAVTGQKYLEFMHAINARFFPNKVLAGANQYVSSLELLKGRADFDMPETTAHVCYGNACKLPVKTVEEVFAQLKI